MRRWLIAAGFVVVVLVAALAVAMANLGRFLASHRDTLAARAAREIGRTVELGDVSLSLRGGPGVRIAGVRVVEDPEWGDGDLLRADEVWVTVRLFPSLVGRFEIARIRLARPVLTVIRDARGWNLATLGRRRRPDEQRSEPEPRAERARRDLVIGLADVHDGEVRYVDRRADPALELVARRVAASASDVLAGRPIAVALRAALLGAEAVNFDVTGNVGPFDDTPVPARLPVDLRWTLADTDAAALVRAAPVVGLAAPRELIVAGPLSAHGRAQGPLEGLAGEVTVDGSGAAVRLGTAFAKASDVAFTTTLHVSRADDGIAVRRAVVALGDATLDVTGTVRPGDPVTVDLRLVSNAAPLATLAAVAPSMAGADVGGTIEAQLAVQGAWRAQPPPAVNGTLALTDVRGRRAGDRVGLSGLTTTLTVSDGVARMPATRFRIGASSVEASGAFQIAERLLTVAGESAEVFGGTVAGNGRMELADPKLPRFSVEGTARGVALGPLLAARESPLAAHVEGLLDADVSLAAAGTHRRAVRRSLAGRARIDVRDGALRGVKIVDDVLGVVTGIDAAGQLVPARLRRKRPELFGGADTKFEELRATARIEDRHAITDDLVVRTGSYTITGRGRVSFAGDTELTARFIAGPALTADVLESFKDARWALDAEQRLDVPFRVAGRFPELRPRVDPEFVARVAGRAVEARARKALRGDGKDDRQGGLVDDALRQLQRLLGR